MNYFYNVNGQNRGPVTLDELHRLAGEGTISGKTPVIEEGGAQWTRYAALGGLNLPAPPSGGSFNKLLNINDRIDLFLARILRVPTKVPQGDEPRLQLLGQWGRILSVVIWAAYLLVATGASRETDDSIPFALAAAAGLVIGFFAQYGFYQCYTMTSSLLLGQKIVLSSMAPARLLAMLSVGLTIFFAISVFTATNFPDMALMLILGLTSVAMAFLFFNAEQFIVSVQPGKVSPGRELNNAIRLALRGIFFSFHLLTPIAVAIAAVALTVSFSWNEFFSGVYSSLSLFLIAPAVIFLGLSVTSWFFDMCDAIFSLGEPKQP